MKSAPAGFCSEMGADEDQDRTVVPASPALKELAALAVQAYRVLAGPRCISKLWRLPCHAPLCLALAAVRLAHASLLQLIEGAIYGIRYAIAACAFIGIPALWQQQQPNKLPTAEPTSDGIDMSMCYKALTHINEYLAAIAIACSQHAVGWDLLSTCWAGSWPSSRHGMAQECACWAQC